MARSHVRNASQLFEFSKSLSRPSLRLAASGLSGLLLFACFPSLDWDLLVWVACLPLLIAVVSEPQLVRAFFLGFLAGAIFLAGNCYWFVIVTKRYGGLSTALAVGVLAAFVIGFSIFLGVFGLVESWVARRSVPLALMLSPFLWVSLELARTYYFIAGFPWNLLGYAVEATGLKQLAAFTAVYGLSFLAMATSALAAWALLEPSRRWVRTALAIWLGALAVTNWIATPPLLPPGSNDVYLVQPNVPLEEKALEHWVPEHDRGPLDRLVAMTLESRARNASSLASPPLLIWSENPAPFYFNRDPLFREAMERMAREAQAYVVAGTVNFVGNDVMRPTNTAVVLDPEGRVQLEYDKIHLVPFGEYVPDWVPAGVGKITSEVGNYVAGSKYVTARTPAGTLSIFICYEAIFPQLVRRLVPPEPGVLVNISNDAWYGDSSAAEQHLMMARLRAVENGRFLLRATNDGITAVIDPYGRVVEQLPRRRQMVLPGHFNYLGGRTFYSAYGDVFAWMCVMLTVFSLAGTMVPKQAFHKTVIVNHQ